MKKRIAYISLYFFTVLLTDIYFAEAIIYAL